MIATGPEAVYITDDSAHTARGSKGKGRPAPPGTGTQAQREAYFRSETRSQKAARLAHRAGKVCNVCKGTGHFGTDPECPMRGNESAAFTDVVIDSDSD